MKVKPVAGAREGVDLRPAVLEALGILARHGWGQDLVNIAAMVEHLLPRKPLGLVLAVAQALNQLEREGRVRGVRTAYWQVYLLDYQLPSAKGGMPLKRSGRTAALRHGPRKW